MRTVFKRYHLDKDGGTTDDKRGAVGMFYGDPSVDSRAFQPRNVTVVKMILFQKRPHPEAIAGSTMVTRLFITVFTQAF